MTTVEVDDNSDSDGRFGCRDGDDEQGKEQTIHFVWPEIFVECYKIQVHAVQDQLNAHEHGDQVPSREKSIHTNKEKCRADEQYLVQSGLHHGALVLS